MKAIVCTEYGPLQNLSIKNWQAPAAKAGEIVIRVKAIGVNFPDALLVRGLYQIGRAHV